MKLGCSSWSYHAAFRAGRIDMREWLRVCAEDLEVDGVELLDLHFPTTDPAYLRDIKKLCTDLHLTLSGVAVSNDFGPDERRSRETQKVQQWCDIAAYLGAPIVRVFAGWLPAAAHSPEQGRIVGMFRRVFGQRPPNTRRIWSDVSWSLRQCADYAAERAVVLALQNNRGDGLVGSPAQIDQCLHDVGSPWLRACLDPADLAGRANADLVLPHAVQVHARIGDVADDGDDPNVHWPEIIRMLQINHYRGFIHIDYEGVEDPLTAVPRAVRHFRGLLHLAQRQHLLHPPAATEPAADAHAAPLVEMPRAAEAPATR
ncbi:MAG TPA: sugar phosphate isomerase/epimerase family protein [Dehalococcoidia bacterium]|nr:sugar phosphate isomerase/epimerase family protein [Dehalococcoidia bacterium]